MLTSAALFTENIYKPMINPDRDDKHYILCLGFNIEQFCSIVFH